MSYQSEEVDPLIPTAEFTNRIIVENQNNNKINVYKYIAIFTTLAMVIVLTVSVTDYKPDKPTSANLSGSKLQLVKSGRAPYNVLDDESKEVLFDEFAQKFKKNYANDDIKKTKFNNFKSFLAIVDERTTEESENGGTAKHGITKFSDMSPEEFKANFLGYRPVQSYNQVDKLTIDVINKKTESTFVDWTGVKTTAVKDQGYCGSCWAFSVTEQIESDSISSGLLTTEDTLSPQQIVSCDTTDYGCDGGNTETAYAYVMKAGGLENNSAYPYSSYYGTSGSCLTSSTSEYKITISKYHSISGSSPSKTEDLMQQYVLTTGPLSVCLDASNWSTYTSGVLSTCGTEVNHCVQVVGVDTTEKYWIVRNSWSTDWGINGFIYIKSGSNTCRIAFDPTYVTPTKV